MEITLTPAERSIYNAATQTFGVSTMRGIFNEEIGECLVALSHLDRNRETSFTPLQEELADLYVVLHQMILYYGEEPILEIANAKLRRLKARVAANNPNLRLA